MDGKAVVTAYEHVCVEQGKDCRASVSPPFEEWGQLSVNNLIRY